jgi:hypothetical protein
VHALVPSRGTLEIDMTMRPLPRRLQTIEVRPQALLFIGGPDAARSRRAHAPGDWYPAPSDAG